MDAAIRHSKQQHRDKIIRNGEHIHWYHQSELFRLPKGSVFSPYSLMFFAIFAY
jgi:hypothetical protein